MSAIFEGLDDSIVIDDNENVTISEEVVAPVGLPAVNIEGDNGSLDVQSSGAVLAPDDGNTAVLSSGDRASISNAGTIAGDFNGISSTGDRFRLANSGQISSNSRAVDLSDGDGSRVINSGQILGTDDQRNGTLYVDGTVDNLRVTNTSSGVIDAGAGNLGDAVSVQVGAEGDPGNDRINISNNGLLQGRGDGPDVFADGARVGANGSSGLRFFNGSGNPEATISGSVRNNGTITSEVSVGFLGGVVVEDGVAFDGRIVNGNSGQIFGPNNGLYIGNAEHDLDIINRGSIRSGSRAVNLDGDNVDLTNRGTILGEGDQRNGTLYIDGTGDNIRVANARGGLIDAGGGNSGSGVSVQVGAEGDAGNDDIDIVNFGVIQGRGTENVPAGVRLFVGSGLDEATFNGSIVNQRGGTIVSETDAGVLIEEGVIFDGSVVNRGVIRGGNGIAIDAEGALGSVEVSNTGTLDGDVLLGSLDDVFRSRGNVNGSIFGLEGDDRLIGGRNSEVLVGGEGDDVLTGGRSGAQDRFVFAPTDFGADTVTDFQNNIDLLDVSAFNFGVSDLQSVISGAQQIGGDSLLTLAGNNTVLLQGVNTNVLDSSDFIV